MIPSLTRVARLALVPVLLIAAVATLGSGPALAGPGDSDKPLVEQLRELRERLAKLEAAVAAKADPAHASGAGMSPAGGMAMPGGMDGMDAMMGEMKKMMGGMAKMMGMMMDMDKAEMGGMGGSQPAGGMAGGAPMPMMDDDDEMGMASEMGMGPMPAKGGAATHSSLPGFPGASHLYHIGATGFFLDHPTHVTLTAEQQKALNGIKEKALLAKSTSARKVEEAEQALWTLTGSDSPDAGQIEAKVREIEGLRSEQRLAFIRAVGDAANVLTEEQRKTLSGDPAAAAKPAAKDPHAGH